MVPDRSGGGHGDPGPRRNAFVRAADAQTVSVRSPVRCLRWECIGCWRSAARTRENLRDCPRCTSWCCMVWEKCYDASACSAACTQVSQNGGARDLALPLVSLPARWPVLLGDLCFFKPHHPVFSHVLCTGGPPSLDPPFPPLFVRPSWEGHHSRQTCPSRWPSVGCFSGLLLKDHGALTRCWLVLSPARR